MCVRAACRRTGIIPRAPGHHALCSVEYGVFFFECLGITRSQPPLHRLHERHPLRHHFGPRCNEWPQRLDSVCSHQDDRCRKLEHVSFVAVQRGCPHLGSEPSHKNRLDSVRQGLGAIVTYLVVFEGSSSVIDWLALSCFDVRTPHLNLSAMATR